MIIKVCARSSPLSRLQTEEILQEIKQSHPHVEFACQFLKTTGDLDQKTSLRILNKTDFFTKELDQLVHSGKYDISIHSKKDLPEPLPTDLVVIATTHGKDPGDSLVLRKNETFESLPTGSTIATSSIRREDMIRKLRSDLNFADLRGPIEKRLEHLEKGSADGAVIAEAALLRLVLNPNRIRLPGPTVPGQGQLAIVAHKDNQKMAELFACIDTHRINTLYTGIDIAEPWKDWPNLIHCPLIDTEPCFDRNDLRKNLEFASHILFTSKSTVRYLLEDLPKNKKILSVGQATTTFLKNSGFSVEKTALQESSEGVVDMLKTFDHSTTKLFWPHSTLSRPVITNFLSQSNIQYKHQIIYNTKTRFPNPQTNFDLVREVVFTSPSTIDAFQNVFGHFPKDIFYTSIGPVTENAFKKVQPR